MKYVLSSKGFIIITPSEGNYLYNGDIFSEKVFTKTPKYWSEITKEEKYELERLQLSETV